jgi:hypothetical protein
VLSRHTAKVTDDVHWSATLVIKDADGRIGQEYTVGMRVVTKLPPPTIASIDPTFGWRAAQPVVPNPVVVTVRSSDDDFDSRTRTSTQVFSDDGRRRSCWDARSAALAAVAGARRRPPQLVDQALAGNRLAGM